MSEFINCTSENMWEVGANVYGHSTGKLKVRYVNCNWKGTTGPAVRLNLEQPSMAENPGEILAM